MHRFYQKGANNPWIERAPTTQVSKVPHYPCIKGAPGTPVSGSICYSQETADSSHGHTLIKSKAA